MAEYVPRFTPASAFTSTASAAVTGGQVLGVSGSGSVAPTAGVTVGWVGVAAFDAANGERVTVHAGGVQLLTASGAVNAGDLVVPAAAGRVAAVAAPGGVYAVGDVTNTRAIVGLALTTAADGAKVEVRMER